MEIGLKTQNNWKFIIGFAEIKALKKELGELFNIQIKKE